MKYYLIEINETKSLLLLDTFLIYDGLVQNTMHSQNVNALVKNELAGAGTRFIHSSFISSITEILEIIQHYISTMLWSIHDNNNYKHLYKIKRKKKKISNKQRAVSYTHLRAHETSLHPVCRLLLEKTP